MSRQPPVDNPTTATMAWTLATTRAGRFHRNEPLQRFAGDEVAATVTAMQSGSWSDPLTMASDQGRNCNGERR